MQSHLFAHSRVSDFREPVTADDLGVGGALAVLMKDAIAPTLMQVRYFPSMERFVSGLTILSLLIISYSFYSFRCFLRCVL